MLPEDWQHVPPADDPFVASADGLPTCDESGFRVEEGALELDTNTCSWATFKAPLPFDLRAGDELSALVFHGPLASIEPAEGRVFLDVGGTRIVDETVAIPSIARLYDETLTLDNDVAGDAWLHIHNHGGNDWRFAHLRVTSARRDVRRRAD